jgi:hypothetical protein
VLFVFAVNYRLSEFKASLRIPVTVVHHVDRFTQRGFEIFRCLEIPFVRIADIQFDQLLSLFLQLVRRDDYLAYSIFHAHRSAGCSHDFRELMSVFKYVLATVRSAPLCGGLHLTPIVIALCSGFNTSYVSAVKHGSGEIGKESSEMVFLL